MVLNGYFNGCCLAKTNKNMTFFQIKLFHVSILGYWMGENPNFQFVSPLFPNLSTGLYEKSLEREARRLLKSFYGEVS